MLVLNKHAMYFVYEVSGIRRFVVSKLDSQAISFRIDRDKVTRLERLAAATDRSRSWHLEQALDAYLETQAWQVGHIEQGLADAEAGRVVPHERVRDWLKTWGRDDEGEPPA